MMCFKEKGFSSCISSPIFTHSDDVSPPKRPSSLCRVGSSSVKSMSSCSLVPGVCNM